MDKLITITEQKGIQLVDARELHRKLQTGRDFSNQIKGRIREYGFIENEDYFIIEKSEKLRSENLTLKNLWDNAPAAKEIILFTESGYLMLVKTFTDDLSWDIQRQLVKGYFKLKENNQKSLTLPQQLLAQAQYLVEIDNRVSVVEDKVDNEIRVDNGEQRKIQKAVGTRIYQRIDIVPQLAENKKFVFQALYRDLKDRFGVASYRDIKRKDLTNCLEYISTWIEPADLRIGA